MATQDAATRKPPSTIAVDEVVTPYNVLSHIHWLRYFFNFRSKSKDSDLVYLLKAEQRYQAWLAWVHSEQYWAPHDKLPVPPADVLQIWHTHLLSPWRYREDITRLYGAQSRLFYAPFPLYMVTVNPGDADDATVVWNEVSERAWNTIMNGKLPYRLTNANLKQVAWTCSWCNTLSVWSSDKYIKFANGESLECSSCKAKLTYDNLSAKRFIQDVTRCFQEETYCLAGTLQDELTGQPQLSNARRIFQILFPHGDESTRRLLALGASAGSCNWAAIEVVFSAIEARAGRKVVVFDNIRRSYKNVLGNYSLDLVQATIRQRRFTDKTTDVSWSKNDTLVTAINRYKGFINIMQPDANQTMVPTLDIDLAWHTHMLFHQRYCAYTHNVGRRILYHDDTMPDQQLRSGFERTAALWLSTYNMPYVRRLTQSTTDPSGKSNRGANADGKVKPAMIRSLLHWKNKATGEQGPAERKEHGPAAVANENERIMQAQGHKHLPSVPPPGPPSLPPPGPPSLPPPRPSSVAPPRPSSVAPPRPSSVAPPRPSSVAPPGPPPVPPHLPPPAPVDPNANINGNGYYQPADPPRRTVSVNGVDPNSRMYYPAQQYGSMSPGSRPAVVQELSNAQPTQSRSSRYSTFSEPGRYYGTPQYQQQQQYSQSVPTSPASVYSVPGGYYGGAPSNWAALPPGAVPSSPAPTLSSPYQSYPDAYPDTNGTRSPPFRPASPTGPSLLTRGFAPLPGPAWDQYQSPPAPVYALGGSAKEEFYESNKVETGVLFDPQLTAIVGGMRGIDLNGKELADGSERANGSQIGGQAQFGSNGSTKEQAGVQL